jgi:hypothetical protein
MTLTAKFARVCAAALLSVAVSAPLASSAYAADDLISFLWGGDAEWGGGSQTVRFSPQYKAGQVIVSFGDH